MRTRRKPPVPVRPAVAACTVITATAVAFGMAPAPTTADRAIDRQVQVAEPSAVDERQTADRRAAHPAPPDPRNARANRTCVKEGNRVTCRRYAGLHHRRFAAGKRPTGAGATFTVHRPRQVRRYDHSLAEIAIHKPGSYGTYVEVGWRRYGKGKTRLFVFRWNKGKPSCYNKCGFKPRGKGLKPGSVLRPGTTFRGEWRHHHHRWNLYINGKWSGFYPDRLWKGTFHHGGPVQFFGEVSFRKNGKGRCVDMGSGRFPRYKSARIFKIRYLNTPAAYKGGVRIVSAPKMYKFKRTSPRSFKYGGPGPC